MIKYKTGCLISAAKGGEVNVIAHQSNCFNVFGAGVAKVVKENFPEAYKADILTSKGDVDKLGTFSSAYNSCFDVTIFNLYGQYRYGRKGLYTNYAALNSSLRLMEKHLKENSSEPIRVGIPKIGCGLAGGEWVLVERMLEEHLGDFDVTVYEL